MAPTKKKPATAPPKKAAARKPATAKAPVKQASVSKTLLDKAGVEKAITDLATSILAEFPTPNGLALLGIRTRGVILAERIKLILENLYGAHVATGAIDITFYRDDLSRIGPHPIVQGSEFPFDITDANVVLIDDVLFTGRTVRAALDEITDFGRPAIVRLATLVDRGMREYPIQPDYCGLRVSTTMKQQVHVHLDETDDEDSVILETKG